MLKVAIIDDGINPFGLSSKIELENDIIIASDLKIDDRVKQEYILSHGTVCSNIILNCYPNVNISSIKILNDNRTGNVKQLIVALEWCIIHDISVVNMSLGSVHYHDYDELRLVVNKAYNSGIILIAANNNKNIRSFPAFFSNVIGVRCRKIPTKASFRFNPYPIDGVDVDVSYNNSIFSSNSQIRGLIPSNSYAAAYITAIVCKYVSEKNNASIEDVRAHLSSHTPGYNPSIYNYVDWSYKAFVFYITNKDYNFGEKNDQLAFEVINYTHYRVSSLIDGLNKVEKAIIKSNFSHYDTIVIYSDFYANSFDNNKLNQINIKLQDKNINSIINIQGFSPISTTRKTWLPISTMLNTTNPKIKNSLNVPLVICLFDNDDSMIHNIQCTISEFKNDGYNAISISSEYASGLYGFLKVDDGEAWYSDACFIEECFHADIIIIGINITKLPHQLTNIIENADLILNTCNVQIKQIKNSSNYKIFSFKHYNTLYQFIKNNLQ